MRKKHENIEEKLKNGYTALVIRVQIDVRAWQSKHPGSLQQTAAVFLFLFFFYVQTRTLTQTHSGHPQFLSQKTVMAVKARTKAKTKTGRQALLSA